MIIGIGVDIIEIDRVKKAIEKKHFVEKIFSKAEKDYCEGRGKGKAASFAARFAAKEAFVKSLGTGHIGGALREISVENDERGCPKIILSGFYKNLAQEKQAERIEVSMSHSHDFAVAQVLLWRCEK